MFPHLLCVRNKGPASYAPFQILYKRHAIISAVGIENKRLRGAIVYLFLVSAPEGGHMCFFFVRLLLRFAQIYTGN